MSAVIIRGLVQATSPDRLYPIQPCPGYSPEAGAAYDFYPGHVADGRQLLAAEWRPDLLVALFDPSGELLEVQYRTLEAGARVEHRLQAWYGFALGAVQVKQFRIAPAPNQPSQPLQLSLIGEPGFAVRPFPLDWSEFFEHPTGFTADDQTTYLEMIQGWIERGNFTLYWGNELFLDGSGAVVGS